MGHFKLEAINVYYYTERERQKIQRDCEIARVSELTLELRFL